jgi:hypothetical protein
MSSKNLFIEYDPAAFNFLVNGQGKQRVPPTYRHASGHHSSAQRNATWSLKKLFLQLSIANARRECFGRRAGDPASTDAAVHATDILNDDGLTKRRPHSLGQDPSNHVRQPAREARSSW